MRQHSPGLVERVASAVRDGRLTAQQSIAVTLERLNQHNPALKAFLSVDATEAVAQARVVDAGPKDHMSLAGIPIGVKDIIDVCGTPTRAGSRAMEGAAPAVADAEIVARLRNAGAIIVGKTKTTELATMDPTDTVNPYDPSCTPGGSSSGSGAAVGAGLVPVALGTQTAGSLCRPAAYCGAAAFKPTHNRIPLTGIVPLATSFDTVGPIARSQRDCAQVMAALGTHAAASEVDGAQIAIPDSALWYTDADASMLEYLDYIRGKLIREGARLTTIPPLFDRAEILFDHRIVMAREAYRAHQALFEASAAIMGPNIVQLLAEGMTIPDSAAAAARSRLASVATAVWTRLESFDACLLLPTPAPAPRGHATTGNASYLIPWSSFLGPLATLAGRLDRNELPIALMLAAAPGADERLLGLALSVEALTDELPMASPFFGAPVLEEVLR